MKVICAGAPKTGTKSLAKALRILGYDDVYDYEEAVHFAFDEWEDVLLNRTQSLDTLLDTKYKDVQAVVDFPHSYFFDEFLRRWPDAKVILMTRNEDAWFRSFKTMVDEAAERYPLLGYCTVISPSLARFLKWNSRLFEITLGTHESLPQKLIWQKWYRRHNVYVKSTVRESQLLEFNVKEGWRPLCEFLGKPVPEGVEFPRENVAHSTGKSSAVDRAMQDTVIMRNAAWEIKVNMSLLLAAVVAVVVLALLSWWS